MKTLYWKSVSLDTHYPKCCDGYFNLINLIYILLIFKSSHFDESRYTFSFSKGDSTQMLQPLNSRFEKSQADVIARHKIAFRHNHMGYLRIFA